MYKYFVSYAYTTAQATVFGNCIINIQKKLDTYDDILEVEKQIKQREDINSLPIILCYRRMIEE